MKKILFVYLFVCLFVSPSYSRAEGKYPYLKEDYKDCEHAIKLAETDLNAFMRTRCAGEIVGFSYGFYVGSGGWVKNETDNSVITAGLCYPKRESGLNETVEVAKDFLRWMDKRMIIEQVPMSWIIREMYRCNQKKEK
jgi:hypothetical protein